jgi:very-short-patch-repair endonuclease
MARKATIGQARALRRSPPVAERVLWRILRGRQLEVLKFRRQWPIGPYVADFACLRHRLIVEVDGPFHDPEQDAARYAWLANQGFQILRFATADVALRPHDIVERIIVAVEIPPLTGKV